MVGEVASFCSGVLASVLADVLGKKGNKVRNNRNKNRIEEKIIEDLDSELKDQFEQETVKEWILQHEYQIRHAGYIFNQNDTKEFLNEFFQKNPSLNYVHSKKLESVIFSFIDEINNWANEILSDESKMVIEAIRQDNKIHEKNLFAQLSAENKEILNNIQEIKSERRQWSKEEIKKKCIGYGSNRGKCQNLILVTGNMYCIDCLRKEYFDKIENLYRIQNYLIKTKVGYFVAEQKSGIIKSNALIIPIYSETDNISQEDVEKIIEIINNEEQQYIHIVSNAEIGKNHKGFFESYKYKLKIFDEHEIINEIMDFTLYLENNIDQYRNSNLYEHYIDIFDLNTNKPLEYSVKDFLEKKDDNAFLILGDYGCGKTSFLLNMSYKLSDEFLHSDSEYIPIFVPLKKYAKAINLENLFLDIFVNECHMSNVSIEAFKLMMKYMKFVLLFDGFDEVAKRVNYDVKFEIFNQICQFCNENTKVIITCRPNFFQENREYKKLIQNAHLQFEPNLINKAIFVETYIDYLNPRQIHDYILSYRDILVREGLDIEKIEYLIGNTHDLTDLSRRPFLLNIIILTLPKMISNIERENLEDLKINAALLYRNYTDLWLDRENSKGKTLIRKEDKLHFCMHIAYKMFKEDVSSIHFSNMPNEIREYFPDLHQMDEIDYFSHDIQSCSFMNSEGNGYFKFIHKSFMEYFVACYIAEMFQKNQNQELEIINTVFSIKDISTEVALFINDILCENDDLYQKIKDVLEKQIINSDDSIKKNVVTILSKMDHNIAINIKNNVSYAEGDFSYATIENRIIKGVDFSRATFYGATIHNVQFINCNFTEVNFQKAYLCNVDFSGQSLEYADMSYCEIQKCSFEDCLLAESKISHAILSKNNFSKCDMSGIEADGTKYDGNYNFSNVIGVPYEMD